MDYIQIKFIFIIVDMFLTIKGLNTTIMENASLSDGVGDVLHFWKSESKQERFQPRSAAEPNAKKSPSTSPFFIDPVNKIPNSIYESDSYQNKSNDPSWHGEGKVASLVNKDQLSRKGGQVKEVRTLRNRGDSYSTRVAALYLMQHKGDPKPDQASIEESTTKRGPATEPKNSFNADDLLITINPFDIKEQIGKILSEFDNVEFETEVLGRTVSYIDIFMFKITQRGSKYFRSHHEHVYVENEKQEKKILFIVHSLTPMGLGNLYILTVESYLRKLFGFYVKYLDKFDIWLVPLANPDGYLQVKKGVEKIYWNKNVSPNTACPGVDVDRNFDVAWNGTNDHISSCSQHYPGKAPFTEPESRAIRDIFHQFSHKIIAYIHVHGGTYTMNTFKGDAVLYPKGYTDQRIDEDKYIDIKAEIDEAIKNANFKVLSVTVDTMYSWYGRVTGTSVDYASTVYGIPFAMEFVIQLYQDAFETHFQKIKGKGDLTMEGNALNEIWRRVIDVVFTNIYNKMENNEASIR